MISIDIGPLFREGSVEASWEIELNVNAAMRVIVMDEVILDEPSFPVLELARQIVKWNYDDGCFEYFSTESDSSPFVLFQTMGGYYVASPMSGVCSTLSVAKKECHDTLRAYVERVREAFNAAGLESGL